MHITPLRKHWMLIFCMLFSTVLFAQKIPDKFHFDIYTTQKIDNHTLPNFEGKSKQKLVKRLAGECAPDTIILTNQDQVDSFPYNYPDCHSFKNILVQGLDAVPAITNLDSLSGIEEVTDKLLVDNTNITTLAGLQSLKRVGIWFEITNDTLLQETGLTNLESLGVVFFSNLPSLTDMTGLTSNFTNYGTFTLVINGTGLSNLHGLENIHTVPNMYISGNFSLTSLDGLQNLTESGGGISMYANTTLTDITAFSNITSLNFGPLEIQYHYALKDLTGLHNLEFIKKHLWLEWNVELETLEPLNDLLVIEDEDSGMLKLKNNQNLSFCSEPSICNFLGNGGGYEINDNANGCETITQIESTCGLACSGTSGQYIIFTGDVNDDWDNAGNWNLNRVPEPCDTVEIPSGKYVNLTGSIIIGTLLANGADIEANEHNINIQRNANLYNTNIYNANTVQINGIEEIQIADCRINGNLKIIQVRKALFFTGSDIYSSGVQPGNLEIKDTDERVGDIIVEGNYIEADFILNINTKDENAHTRIAQDNDVEVNGSISIMARNRGGEFRLGKLFQGRLNIRRNLTLDAEETDYPMLSKIRFMGNEPSEIIKAGAATLQFEEIYFEKDWKELETTFNEDITITDRANFYNGLAKPLNGKKLIFESNSFVSVYSSGSWVSGTVRKIGSSAFTFPVGSDTHQGVIGIYPDGSASNDVAFDATYFPTNPTGSGYDTAQHGADLPKVSGNEFWRLEQVSGTPVSNRQVLLRYDSLYSQKTNFYFDLRVAAWDGTKWLNKGINDITGNNAEAYVKSDMLSEDHTIFTLGYIPTRLPEITIGPIPTAPCRGQTFKLPIDLDTTMIGGNTFQVHLSNSDGNFNTYTIIGQKLNVSNSDTILTTIPFGATIGQNLLLRVVGISPNLVSTNTHSVTVAGVPQQAITLVGPDKVCLNSGVAKYYVQTPEPGATYTWSITFGMGTYTTNHDTAFVTWTSAGPNRAVFVTSSNNCGTGQGNNKQNILITEPPPAFAPILTTNGRWIYASQHIPPQAGISIRWFRNGIEIPGVSQYSYYAGVAGNYTTVYFNNCSNGPLSNAITFAANAVPQSITFENIPNKQVGDAPFSILAGSTSGLPVILSHISGPGNLTAGVYTITNTGTVTIRASQAGDNIYDSAAYVTRTFEVTKASQSIHFTLAPELLFPVAPFQLNGNSSSGLPVSYQVNNGNATITSGNVVSIAAPGLITITANQGGNNNYFAAPSLAQSTCVRVNELTSIIGAPFVCPGQTTSYSINNINGLAYSWRLSNGTSFAASGSSVNITWTNPGIYTLIVSAQANCGTPTTNDSLQVQVLTAVTPGAPGNLLPASNANGLALPLLLSWTAGTNALNYDIFIWDSGTTKPSIPFASNITAFGYPLPLASLAYNKAYHWQVVSKNACLQTESAVQTFRLRPLPDLMVTQVDIPANANSGQTVSINWTVKNIGPGHTTTNQNWTDAVFLSFDTFPNFTRPPQVQAGNWNQGEFPVRTLLLASKPNVTALDSGQQYSNSVDFTIPINFSAQYYAYVITNFPTGQNAPQQMTMANDTLRAPNALQVIPSPTPDLRVENVLVPTVTFSGSTINVNYRVKNYGVVTPLPSKWTDRIYISPSPLFNINNAILLKQPKGNGTYYPNALDASFDTTKQLANDGHIDLQTMVVVPNFIQGTWFVHVHTNAKGSIYEGPLANNNINNTSIQILLTPTPGFIVNNLNVPFSTTSITQPLSISYNVFNTGFFDNYEKLKGHYYVPATCDEGSGFRDSLGHGGSTWQDLVYISNNPNGLVAANSRLLGTLNHTSAGYSADTLLPTYCPFPNTPFNINTNNVVRPSSNHPQSLNFTMPSDLLPGTYYLYIHANHNKQVFEFPDTPVVRRSAPIVVNRPDLAITQLNVPANAVGDAEISLTYTVKNNGAGSVYNGLRRDMWFISNSPVFDGTATFLSLSTLATTMAPGAETSHSFKHTFAAGTTGMRYFHLIVNFDSTFRETNYANNRSSAGVQVSTATPADLIVSNIQLPDTIYAYKNNRIRYTISNNGPANASGTWYDSIFVSCSPTYSTSTAFFVQARQQVRNLGPGVSITDSFNLVTQAAYLYNPCFGINNETNLYVFVKVNANSGVFEGSNTNNNVIGSSVKRHNNTHVDHIVTHVSGSDSGMVGRTYSVNWMVQNIGLQPTEGLAIYRYNYWADGVYFSPDSVYNTHAIFAGGKSVLSKLAPEQQYAEQTNVVVPKLPTGDYYLHTRSDYVGFIGGEIEKVNNTNVIRTTNGTAKKIHIEQLPLPDLVNLIESVPAISATGQPIKLNYRVKNEGVGPAFPNSWTDNIWLSTDLIPNNGNDVLLSTKIRTGGLSVGSEYQDSITATIPLSVATGNYILLVHTDAAHGVIELSDSNNLVFAPLTVYTPASSDLIVDQVSHPDTAWLGYPIDEINWQVSNISANTAAGVSADGIYLSRTGIVDSTAILQGVLNKSINLPPLAGLPFNMEPIVTGVTEGNYRLLVRTDLLNNIPETDKTNNTGQSGTPIFIGVKALLLNEPEHNTLQNTERYYKLNIPDSLRGATILVTLKTTDSLTLKNELFAGAGYIPGASRFDYRFETPNSGNQTLLIESANDPTYYIAVRSATPNPPLQNITLTAVKLPFAILTIQSNSGGNGGNVTVKISGSRFTQGMTARLSKTGSEIEATKIFFVSGGLAFATFPLQGKPLGLYSLSLHKTDGSVAELPNSFSVVAPGTGGLLTGGGVNTGPNNNGTEPGCDPGADAGLNSQLVTELVYPAKVFHGQTFPVQIKFTNPTNMDIPVPTRVLYNDLKLKMSQSLGTVDSGSNPIVLRLSETGGPPGIIRAGGSGSVNIYCRAPLIRGSAIVTFSIQ